MASHNISHSSDLTWGNFKHPRTGRYGADLFAIQQVSLGAPTAIVLDGIVVAAAASGTTAMTLASTDAAQGAVYGRALQVDSTNAGDTTQTLTILGKDYLGATVTETIAMNGTTAVSGKKAFFTVTSITPSATTAGNVTIGTTDILGLPYALGGHYDILNKYVDGTVEAIGTNQVAQVTTTATATTGDVRGTWTPGTATNGTRVFRIWYKIFGVANNTQAYGVSQFAG